MRSATLIASVGLSLLVTSVALAETHDAGHSVAAHDAGHPVAATHDAGPPETADQKAYKQHYIKETAQREGALLKGLVWTPDVSKTANEHWRRAYRALRVRELAQDDKETAVIGRVDQYLKKLDTKFFATLGEMVPTLPKLPAAPAITAPAAGSSAAIGAALTISMTPGAGVTADEYYCAVYDGHHGSWHNYDAKTKRYGASPSCTFPANDPAWSKFGAGKAYVAVHTLTHAKTAKGVEYKMWSIVKTETITLTGGPTTAPATGGAK